MHIEFIGACHEVTGSCHFVSANGHKILIDCGMEQGPDLYENQSLPVNASEIDAVLITHAHIDHSGLLPLLYNHGFRGKIYCTEATRQLCDIMLRDSAHIQESEIEWKNRKARRTGKPEIEPIYSMKDAYEVMRCFVGVRYHDIVNICDGIKARFVDAGHLLGSSSIEVWLREDDIERKIVFSGDIGNDNIPLIKNFETISEADYVLTESTYGDRLHEKSESGVAKNGYYFATELASLIETTLKNGGNLVIPAFSVGRTQEILYFIRMIKEDEMIPGFKDFPVYMDSPLAVEATTIFKENISECFDDEARELVKKGINPISFKGLHVAVTPAESKAINEDKTPKVIISASGMCEAGRIRHHLKHNLWRSECTIAFVGYQVPGTLGHKLLGGADEVRLFGEDVLVMARIARLPGLSGHADRDGLLRWISGFKKPPKKVFVVHGDDLVVDDFAKLITEKTGFISVAPYSGDAYDLITGEQISYGSTKKKERTTESRGGRANMRIYERLLACGQRMLTVIRKNQGLNNKDMAKFADQLTALCDKWDRKD